MLLYRSTVVSETRKFADSLKTDVSVQDIEQETWIRVWTRLPAFKGSDDDESCRKMFASWLRITTHRVALSILESGQAQKRGGKNEPAPLEHPVRDDAGSPSSIMRSDEAREKLTDAIDQIDDEELTQIIRLHYFEGLPISKIATQMGLTGDQVRYRVNLALKTLGNSLDSLSD